MEVEKKMKWREEREGERRDGVSSLGHSKAISDLLTGTMMETVIEWWNIMEQGVEEKENEKDREKEMGGERNNESECKRW